MPSPEDDKQGRHHRPAGEPRSPSPLPPELAEFLRSEPMACVTQGSDQGTVFVIKAPAREIESVTGLVPIHLRHELYDHPAAPVIRMVLTIYDQPQRPLALETFINVEDPQQRDEFAAMAEQEEVLLLFYDEDLTHRLSKHIQNLPKEAIEHTLWQAERIYAEVSQRGLFDFDLAKAEVMKRTTV